jgi:hypothetical protein
MSKRYRDPEWLREQYHKHGKTTREIADVCGCDNATISRWLDKHDIDTRENWKAGVEKAREVNRVDYIPLRTLPHGYEYWQTTERVGNDRVTRAVYVHRLLAVAEYGFDAVVDNDVHHENNIPWDNRPDNIRPVDKADHARIGNTRRISTDELRAELQRLSEQVDGEPTTDDLKQHGRYSYPTYSERFGGWEQAKEDCL